MATLSNGIFGNVYKNFNKNCNIQSKMFIGHQCTLVSTIAWLVGVGDNFEIVMLDGGWMLEK